LERKSVLVCANSHVNRATWFLRVSNHEFEYCADTNDINLSKRRTVWHAATIPGAMAAMEVQNLCFKQCESLVEVMSRMDVTQLGS
jgi:hypothetical protein